MYNKICPNDKPINVANGSPNNNQVIATIVTAVLIFTLLTSKRKSLAIIMIAKQNFLVAQVQLKHLQLIIYPLMDPKFPHI